MEWLSRIQLGADIATGIAIVGALLSWIIQSRADARKQRQRGINDAARAIAVQGIQDVLSKLAQDFNKIVISAENVERRIDAGYSTNVGEWQKSITECLENGRLKPEVIEQDLGATRKLISNFYELVATSRYVLFPSFSSLPESKEVVSRFKADYETIREVYNSLSGGKINLLSELTKLVSDIRDYKVANPDSDHHDYSLKFKDQIVSIVLDPHYAGWVSSFLPNEKQEKFKEQVGRKDFSDHETLSRAMAGVFGNAEARGNELIAQILMMVSMELQVARKECKEFMITLAAISSRLQSKDNGQPVSQLVELLKGDEYFSLEKEVR